MSFPTFPIRVCLKMSCTPLYPMVLLIIIPFLKIAISLGIYPTFSDKPIYRHIPIGCKVVVIMPFFPNFSHKEKPFHTNRPLVRPPTPTKEPWRIRAADVWRRSVLLFFVHHALRCGSTARTMGSMVNYGKTHRILGKP